MPHYRRVGDLPRKRHIVHRPTTAAGRTFEELMGVAGFSGPSSLLYHRHSPSAVVRVDDAGICAPALRDNHPLRPHHLRTPLLASGDRDDAIGGRRALLGSSTVTISYAAAQASSGLYRNSTGDELVFVQSGSAVLDSVFGRLAVHSGDYVVIPMSTTHRWVLDRPVEMLIIAACGHIEIPRRYLNGDGQFLEGAPFSERDLRAPTPEPLLEDGADVPVLVRSRAGLSVHVHRMHPFDVVGWDGCVYPWALNIADFEPITGRVHQPPSVHQTFAGPGFVVCSFVPRLLDTDPDAVKVPYHHSNVDTDEVIFYAGGDFVSRAGSGIGVGSITLHPAGFVHGPQPGSFERSVGVDRTAETAVMIDSNGPLQLTADAVGIIDEAYLSSWLDPTAR